MNSPIENPPSAPNLAGEAIEAGAGGRRSLGVLALFVAVFACAVYLPFLGSGRTLTSHEVMITQPALQLLDDGQWIVPRYAGTFWLDKPPLVNWITALSFAACGGFSEWAARLPAALCATGLCVLVAWMASRFFGRTAGLFAGLIQATCVYGFMQGRLGEIDMPLALLLTGAHAALVTAWRGGRFELPLRNAAAFHALAGLGVLAKGPLAVVLLGVTIFGFCWAVRSWKPLKCVFFTPAIALFLLITVPWHVAAVMVAGDEAWRQWVYNYIYRFAGGIHLSPGSIFLYFYSIPWLAAPWIVVPIFYVRRVVGYARGPESVVHRFLWVWFFAGLAFLTLSSHKHQHYSIPILPPISIVGGLLLAEDARRFGRRSPAIYTAIFGVLLAAYLIVGGLVMPRRDHRLPTVQFVRQSVNALPSEAKLYVVGLGQHSAYPYITHAVTYLNDLKDVQAAIDKHAGETLWMLTLRKHLTRATEAGISFEEVASEPRRERKAMRKPKDEPKRATDERESDDGTGKYAPEELLVLARSVAK